MSVSIDQFNALQAQLAQMAQMMAKLSMVSAPAPASGKSGKAKKERKARDPDAPKKAPTAWALLCKELNPRINALYKSTFADEKVPQGLPMRVCGLLKERSQIVDVSDAQISDAISFIRENPDHKSKTQTARSSKASDAGSVASGDGATSDATAEKPKRKGKPLSDEQKAKMAAGRARKAAEKKAAAAGNTSVVAEPVVVTAPVVVSAPVVTAPVATTTTAPSAEWKGLLLKGKRYLYNPSNFHCYFKEADGSQGAWAGILNVATKTIDDSVPEPGADEDDFDLDDE